jgi:hypothetical protein
VRQQAQAACEHVVRSTMPAAPRPRRANVNTLVRSCSLTTGLITHTECGIYTPSTKSHESTDALTGQGFEMYAKHAHRFGVHFQEPPPQCPGRGDDPADAAPQHFSGMWEAARMQSPDQGCESSSAKVNLRPDREHGVAIVAIRPRPQEQ